MAPVLIEDLKKKRSAAKRKVTLQINDLTPLLDLKGNDANENAKEVKEELVELETRFNTFRLAHNGYVSQLEEEKDEKELDAVLETEQEYLNEVKKSYHDTLKKVKDFEKEVAEVDSRTHKVKK